MLRRARTTFTLVVLTALLMVTSGAVALATGKTQHGLNVDPASQIHVARPGSSFRVPVMLQNSSSVTLRLTANAVAAAGSRDITSLFRIDARAPADPTRNASSWIETPHVTLAPGASRTVMVTVRVPANARPGVHAVIATFSVPTTAPGHGGAGVSGMAGVGSALLLEVPGAAKSSARIIATHGPTFTHGASRLSWSAQIENTGDTLLDVDAELRLNAPWSVARTLGTASQLVLPGGQRGVQLTLDNPPLLGRYRPELIVVGGAGSHVRVSRRLDAVWILPPWWVLALVVAALALAVVGGIARRRARFS